MSEQKETKRTPKQLSNPTPLGPKKVKNDPKIKSNSKVKIERKVEKKLLNYMSRPQNGFDPYPDPKNTS